MEAGGFFELGSELHAAPKVRVGVGFGRDQVIATVATVDTGADVCVFPESLFPWLLPGKDEPDIVLEMADGRRLETSLRYPTLTVGDIREHAVACAILPKAPAILGRSFLNRCALHVEAARDLVRLRATRGAGA